MAARTPEHDSMGESPVTWQDIALGPGQMPGALGHLQFTFEGDAYRNTQVRRAPGYEELNVVARYPWAPA